VAALFVFSVSASPGAWNNHDDKQAGNQFKHKNDLCGLP
jgi:hypothetical protein